MNRGENPRTHQEGAEQREPEGEDGEQHRPALQRIALLDHDRGVEKRRPGEPWHEGRVLDRIPEPPAAPAEFVIGPPAAERDPDGERAPCEQRPRPDPACPGRVHAALDQRGDGEGERDREADIAEIEEGRVEGEAGVLQQRVETLALGRRRGKPDERVGGEQDKGEESRRHQPMHGEHPCPERRGEVATEARDHGAEEGQDQHPQHHRALVVRPDAGNLVDQRLQRVGVAGDERDREVRDREGVDEREEGGGHQAELEQRRRLCDRHHRRIASGRADHRHRPLDQGQQEGEDEREMADFGDHSAPSGAPRHLPDSFSASATSLGM